MSLVQSFKYICIQCKDVFRYNNQCRCKTCGIVDADTCIKCHNNNHTKDIAISCFGLAITYFAYIVYAVSNT